MSSGDRCLPHVVMRRSRCELCKTNRWRVWRKVDGVYLPAPKCVDDIAYFV